MFCKNCGNNIDEGAKFCKKCGKPIEFDNSADNPKIDIEKVRKSLKNTGNSVFAVGWITIAINAGLYIWSVLDKNFSESGLPAIDLTGFLMMVIFSSIFIILGKRISGLVDKNIKRYLQILLVLSILFLIIIVASGGRVGLLFFLIIAYLISSLNFVSKAMKSGEFVATLTSPKYKLDKKGWIIFSIASVVLLFIAIAIDLSKSDVTTQGSEATIEQSLVSASSEINKTLPMMVDKVTQLTSTTASGKELIYSYKLTDTNVKYSQLDLDKYLKNDIINSVCTTSDTRNMINLGAGLVYTYYDNLGKYIGKVSVHSYDCK